MRAAPRWTTRNVLLAATAALLLMLPLVAWRDLVSLERANRLFRGGESADAVRLYRRQVEPEAQRPTVSYNLGTAWLALGSPEAAEIQLRDAMSSTNPEVRYRAAYNLGYLLYNEAMQLPERKMAAPLLGEAVLAYRDALRARPTSTNARWSLAVAMEALDSVAMRPLAALERVPTRNDTVGLEEDADATMSGDLTGLSGHDGKR